MCFILYQTVRDGIDRHKLFCCYYYSLLLEAIISVVVFLYFSCGFPAVVKFMNWGFDSAMSSLTLHLAKLKTLLSFIPFNKMAYQLVVSVING